MASHFPFARTYDHGQGVVHRLSTNSGLSRPAIGLTQVPAYAGIMTLIQRFGGALNLNVRVPMLVLDGVHVVSESDAASIFRRLSTLTATQLQAVLQRINQRVGCYLECRGVLVRDPDQ